MAVTNNDPRPVLRQELERVFKNQRVIRAFEKIFELIPPEFISLQTQVDQLVIDVEVISAELSESGQLSSIQARLDDISQKIDDLQQGPII